MPQLVIEQPGVPPMAVPVSGKEITFGRSEDNDVVLTAEEVSRYHARIVSKDGRFFIVDLKSLNGTYVNRQRITEQTLRHIEDIWLGRRCHLLYRDDTMFGSLRPVPEEVKDGQNDDLQRSIQDIRREMNQAGRDMTLMGRKAKAEAGDMPENPVQPLLSQEELVRMSRAYRRLEALHKAHQVIISNFDLNKRLTDMLETIMNLLQAKRGFVLLREEKNDMLRAIVSLQMGLDLNASSPSMGIAGRAAIDGEPVLMHDRDSNKEFGDRASIIAKRITSAMCVPLKVKDLILGSIYVDTDAPDMHFTEEDLELFLSLASQAALAIDNVKLHDRVVESEKKRLHLARFLPGALVERIMNESETLALGGRKTRVTTLFCDIRGSTEIAEQMNSQSLIALLNEHFTAMTDIVFAYEGTLDKYIGDEIMAVFGAPIMLGEEPYRAVRAAMDMQRRNAELNMTRKEERRPQLQIGIGIDSGEVVAGYIGSPKRMDFTVVGDRVNTAKRFCDMAAPGKIVIGQETWDAVNDKIKTSSLGTLILKGKQQAVRAYEVIGPRK